MTSSPLILSSLSELLKCPIDFTSLVKLNNKRKYIICLGRHSFFLIAEDLTTIKWEIFYAFIEKIEVDNLKYNIMNINFSQNRDDPRIPDSVLMVTDDRNMLLNRFKSVYKTDYMYRLGRIKNLQVVKTELVLSLKNFSEEGLDTGLPSFLFDKVEMIRYNKYDQKGYSYFVLNEYTLSEEGIFVTDKDTTDKESGFFSIQIGEAIPLHTLSKMKDREDLNHYCQYFLEEVMGDSVYWIIHSKRYIKKSNLCLDIAEWTGWEIHVRDSLNRDTVAIILRRKYIPPILDTFQDFAFLIRGSTKDETSNVLKKIRGTVDSIYHTGNNKVYYKIFVQELADALLLDEEGYSFLQVNFDIKPKQIVYALKLLDTILNILKSGTDDRFSNIQNFMRNKYKEYIEGHELWADEKDYEDKKEFDEKKTDVFSLIEKLIKHSCKSTDSNVIRTWKQKFSKYMAYCLDGGLVNDNFCIPDIWKGLVRARNDTQMYNLLSYLLYICPENLEFDYQNMTSRLNKLSTGNYTFNKRVMKTLLENNFLQTLPGYENSVHTSDILYFLIKNSNSAMLQRSICLGLIGNLSEGRSGTQPSDSQKNTNTYRQLITPLIGLFNGKNKSLAVIAGICLINLSACFKELKYLIAAEGGEDVAISNLDCHEEGLLYYTLQFIINLCSMYQNLENFIKKELLPKTIKIIKSQPVPGVFYPEKITVSALQILRLIINHSENEAAKLVGNIQHFVDIIVKDWERSSQINGEVLSLLMKIGKKFIIQKELEKNWLELLQFLAKKIPQERHEILNKILLIILNSIKLDDKFAEAMRNVPFDKYIKEGNWIDEQKSLCRQITLSLKKK